eukprot:8422882-Lingulodinium_polyedra.AAC.1
MINQSKNLRCLQSPIANRNECQSQNLNRKGTWYFDTSATNAPIAPIARLQSLTPIALRGTGMAY